MVHGVCEVAKPMYFYVLFKTTAPDTSAFFGIHRTTNPSYGADGTPMTYIGNGPKLQAKARQYGIQNLRCEVLRVDGDYNVIKQALDRILTPATLADPRCLNMPQPTTNPKVSEALKDLPKSQLHKENIAIAMQDNKNATGHVKSQETKEVISEKITQVRAVQSGKQKYWHNPETGEEITLDADEEGLTGFVLGKLPKALKGKLNKNKKVELSDELRGLLAKD
jgi:uncharacterized membrane-anchored protein